MLKLPSPGGEKGAQAAIGSCVSYQKMDENLPNLPKHWKGKTIHEKTAHPPPTRSKMSIGVQCEIDRIKTKCLFLKIQQLKVEMDRIHLNILKFSE